MIVLLFGLCCPACADTWPPDDPAQEQATVAITTQWATRLRNLRSFHELQQALGAAGRITAVQAAAGAPRAVYRWTGKAGLGRMRVLLYRGGGFAAIISPADADQDIVLNDSGAFLCPSCTPPVDACGHRPPWVPHDLHWDTFDCASTITGPQGLERE